MPKVALKCLNIKWFGHMGCEIVRNAQKSADFREFWALKDCEDAICPK